MIMNILVVFFVLGVGYAWMNRGVFNAMIQALCAFVAGAIAFAFWEPLAIKLVEMSPDSGFFSFIESVAWGVALIVPFSVIMLLLRVATDKLIPNNIKNSTAVDYGGGAIFGLVTGIICAGVLVIGVGNMRVTTGFMGYKPLDYVRSAKQRATGAGSLVKTDTLWIPVDSLVSKTYAMLSVGSMSTSEPLAEWYPELELTGYASRVSPEGLGRNTLRPEDFTIRGTYTVGPEAGSQTGDLLSIRGRDSAQRYVDINGEQVPGGRVYGYVVEFEPNAKERGKRGAGKLIVSNGQVRMLAKENTTGETFTIFPNAVVSESTEPGQFGRWRFDSSDVFISSTGGKSKVPMAFEFLVPTGSTPLALSVKNIRVKTDELSDPVEYPDVTRRDRLVRTGALLRVQRPEVEYNEEYTVSYNPSDSSEDHFFSVGTRMLDLLGMQSARRGFTVNDDQLVVGGEGIWDIKTEVGRNNAGISKKLRVERYAIEKDQALLKLDVGSDSPFGLLTEAAQIAPLDEAVKVIDTNGNEYEAIGYEYKDSSEMRIRYTLGNTLSGLEDTPSLSTTRADQQMRLLFIVTKDVEIARFVIGDTLIARFTPPIETREE